MGNLQLYDAKNHSKQSSNILRIIIEELVLELIISKGDQLNFEMIIKINWQHLMYPLSAY